MDSEKIPAAKRKRMSRSQVKEGVQLVSVESIAQGANETDAPALTPKQKAFVEQILTGESIANAYRVAYNSKGNPNTCHRRGAELMADGRVQAYKILRQAQIRMDKSQNPAEIRKYTIGSLLKLADNDETPPAQRVKCLELLGKITEVALFTERREIIRTTDAGEAKARLLAALQAILKGDATTVEALERKGETLELELREINASPDAATPPPPTPQDSEIEEAGHSHSIPHTQSPSPSEPTPSKNETLPNWEGVSTEQTGKWVQETTENVGKF